MAFRVRSSHSPISQHPDCAPILDAHAACSRLRGIRQILNRHPVAKYNYVDRDYLQDEDWQRGLGALASRGLSFDLQLYPEQMDDAAATARRHSNLTIVLNHTGMPWDRSADGIARWHAGMARLAACPNVVVKISGLGMPGPPLEHGFDQAVRPGRDRSVHPCPLHVREQFSGRPSIFRLPDDLAGFRCDHRRVFCRRVRGDVRRQTRNGPTGSDTPRRPC